MAEDLGDAGGLDSGFGETLEGAGQRPVLRLRFALMFEVVQSPAFPAEDHSLVRSPELTREIWGLANALKCKSFQNKIGPRVMDDHLALQEVGIPAIDIIDFDYPHWHRLSDRPANCDATGPTEVAKVLSVWLQRLR